MKFLKVVPFLMLVVLIGCASKPSHAPAKPVVVKIAILPISELVEVSLENKNGVQILVPIASVGFAVDSHSKQNVFSEQIIAQNLPMGKNLTAYLAQALEKEGFQVVLLDNVPRPADDPEAVDIKHIDTDADAILHVYFDEVGLLSSSFSPDYLPLVNIKAELYSMKIKDDLYDETLCYGVDAKAGETWSIAADPKIAYSSFDNVMKRIPEIAAVFATGTQAIGERLVTEIRVKLK
jgi:hypothetical protein